MKKICFNTDWLCNGMPVTLPHDAQILEPRRADASDGGHGYFPGGVYTYEKKFIAPVEWTEKVLLLEFEGIYRNSTVRLNGQIIGGHRYGYTNFTVLLSKLKYGEENVLTVTADNSQLPNSRWYTGSGIYRPVWLHIGEKNHIAYQGVRISTLSVHPAMLFVKTEHTGGEVRVEVLDGKNIVAQGRGDACKMTVPDAKLWSDSTPYLYTVRIFLEDNGRIVDTVEEKIGIRTLTWSPKGFFVNGKETLLRGGCVHHDNGILGAATYDESEWRRVRVMKEAGFNALRSAHNPCSRAMLDACDYYGVYMMDETFDMWYNRKNKFDYGLDFQEWWRKDTAAMVERDYNHPSVILYSIGNEVAEPHEKEGIKVGREQIDFIHSLDRSRPVTCGVNLMILGRAAKGKGIYQDGEQKTGTEGKKPKKEEGNASLAFNIMASFVGTGMNKGGNSPKVDAIASPFVDSLDIAGYNYGSGRYPLEEKQHPNRIVFGSETFPQDIYKNWDMVKKYPYLVGDFMWTAWDYLGEAGIGAWSYTGGMPFNRPYPWVLAGAGVIDICGIPDASCRYASIVWGLEKNPRIGVKPVNHPGVRPSKSVWRGTNAIESWAWWGCDGNKAEVEVYAQADTVELLLNERSLGKKKLKEFKAVFKTKYTPGTLTAVAYDASGHEIGRHSLRSADSEASITVLPEETSAVNGQIVYVPVELRGRNGVVESNADRKLTVTVEGGELLAFGSANPCTTEQYHTGSFTTYLGRSLAVVRIHGNTTIQASDGRQHGSAKIQVK